MMKSGEVFNRYSLTFSTTSSRDMIREKQKISLEKLVEDINNEEVKTSESPYKTGELSA